MKRFRLGRGSVPVALALITIGAYGLLLPLTGFYWDDWPFAWIAHFQGSAEFIPAFRGFRPFLGPIFYVTTSLLPANPLYWQILALLVRFVSGWAAWFLFGRIWPSRRDIALAAALLFLVGKRSTGRGFVRRRRGLRRRGALFVPSGRLGRLLSGTTG